MKLLQLNITSLNTSVEELWAYQKENNFDAIFLQETNFTEGKMLGCFKNWKTNMLTNLQNKTLGFGVGSLISTQQKSVFRNDLSRKDIELLWNEMQIQGKKVLIGNIYIPPGKINDLYILDMELEKHKGENILLVGGFNSKNTLWDKNAKTNNKMGQVLEDIINRHGLYIATDLDFTYQQSVQVSNSGKSTIDLTLSRGLQNVKVAAKNLDLIKTRHQAIEILIEEDIDQKQNPRFKTKNADWEEWKKVLQPKLEEYHANFPREISPEVIDQQANNLTNLIVESATDFFGLTEITKNTPKRWWNNEIKELRKKLKECKKRCKIRESPTNLKELEQIKNKYKSAISEAKLEQHKWKTQFLNESRDSGQFWHRYDKVLGTKKNNVVEPIYDNESGQYIFNDQEISHKLQKFHIEKSNVNNSDNDFKEEIEQEVQQILENIETYSTEIFFSHKHVKQAIKKSNKHSAPGPDRITLEIIENAGAHLIHCLTHLMQASYLIGYFPEPWKRENRIYLKKPDKE